MKIELLQIQCLCYQGFITQYELSERTGLSRKTVAMLEQTSGANPNLSTLMRIAAYFNVSVEKLIKGQV